MKTILEGKHVEYLNQYHQTHTQLFIKIINKVLYLLVEAAI